MRPVTGSLQQQIRAVLSNCAQFDGLSFANWLLTKDALTRKLAERAPPNRLYRVVSASAALPVYGYVEGYHGAAVVVVTIPTGGTMHVDPRDLEDVTDRALSGELNMQLDQFR